MLAGSKVPPARMPNQMRSAVGLEGRADEALKAAALQDNGAGAIAPQEATRIVRIGEPMNHIHGDHKNRLDSCIGGDQSGAAASIGRHGQCRSIAFSKGPPNTRMTKTRTTAITTICHRATAQAAPMHAVTQTTAAVVSPCT
jgi:hypothetical protein